MFCDIRIFVWQRNLQKMSTERLKTLEEIFVISLLNDKTIILLNLVVYRLSLADSAYGLFG